MEETESVEVRFYRLLFEKYAKNEKEREREREMLGFSFLFVFPFLLLYHICSYLFVLLILACHSFLILQKFQDCAILILS